MAIGWMMLGAMLGFVAGVVLENERHDGEKRAAYHAGRCREARGRMEEVTRHRLQEEELRAANDFLRTKAWSRKVNDIVGRS